MSSKVAIDLRLLVLLLSLISTIIGRKMHTKNESEMKIIQVTRDMQVGYDADDFDCVDIDKQPAFSHPLLKNHKIQMNPSFSKNFRSNEVNSFNIIDIGMKGEGCPLGKVPIQRKKANTSFHKFSSTYLGQHFATLQYSRMGDTYRGARAIIKVDNPHVVDPQISAAYIWVQHGNLSDLNNIQAGWAVHPRLYGDTATRFTTYWTKDNYKKTGCYNMQCPGFVQIYPSFHLGQRLTPSTYGGDQNTIDVMIKQDQASGNWWLLIRHVQVGYWPKEIFSYLQAGATFLQYGGWVFVSPYGNSPPMGNGRFPNNHRNESTYIENIKLVDATYQEIILDDQKTHVYFDTKCYYIIYWHYQGPSWGNALTYGGPGGQCGI